MAARRPARSGHARLALPVTLFLLLSLFPSIAPARAQGNATVFASIGAGWPDLG